MRATTSADARLRAPATTAVSVHRVRVDRWGWSTSNARADSTAAATPAAAPRRKPPAPARPSASAAKVVTAPLVLLN